jgi:hypothetical protein
MITHVCRNVLVLTILIAFVFQIIEEALFLVRNSPIQIPSDSESENGSKPLIHRKRRCYMCDSSTESENSIPPAKHHAIQSKEAVKMFKDIKCAMDEYHEEAKLFRLWRELEQKSALVLHLLALSVKKW